MRPSAIARAAIMMRLSPPWSPGLQYALALSASAAALLVRWMLDPYFGDGVPFLFIFAVLLPLIVVLRPGPFLLGAVTGWLGGWVLFVEPRGSLALDGLTAYVRVGTFGVAILTGSLASWIAARNADSRRRAEEQLRVSEERLQLAKAAAQLGIHDYDVTTGQIEWDERTRELWGVGADEPITYDAYASGLHPDDRQQAAEDLARGLDPANGGVYHSEYRVVSRRDEGTRWIQAKGNISFSSGRPVRLVGTVTDVTAQHYAAEALRLSEERYRSLFTSIDAGFCVIDLIYDNAGHPVDYRFIEANPAFEQQTGLRHAMGKTARALVPDLEPHWFELYGKVALTGEPLRFINEARAMDHRWFEVYASRLGGAGSPRVAILFTDISERKRAELALRESEARYRQAAELLQEADRRKDEFLATLAHELRNPLAPIRLAVPVLRNVREDAGRFEKVVATIERQSSQLVRLIDDLLDVSRITRGRLSLRRQPVTLTAIASQAVESTRPIFDAKGVELSVNLPDRDIVLDADRARLAQVLGNLLANAAKYTERGGQVWLQAAQDGTDAVVRVKDTGVGIPAEHLPKIFDMFTQIDDPQTQATGGLGIGLSLARSLVELHAGSIEARSDGRGTGSEFIVRVPFAGEEAALRAPERLEPTAHPGRSVPPRRILAVDDNADALETLSDVLRLSGHQVRTARDGAAALEAAASWRPDVILLDIGMPGLDGYQVAEQLRREAWGEAVLLVAMTGWGQQKDKVRAVEAGFDAHLTKPADLGALERLLANAAEYKPRNV